MFMWNLSRQRPPDIPQKGMKPEKGGTKVSIPSTPIFPQWFFTQKVFLHPLRCLHLRMHGFPWFIMFFLLAQFLLCSVSLSEVMLTSVHICAPCELLFWSLLLLVWSYWQDLLLLIYHAFLDSFSDVHWCTCEMLRDAKTSRSSVSRLPFGFHIRLSLRILTPIPTHSERAPRATSNELVDLSPKTRQIIFCTEWKAPKAPRKASQSLLLSYLQWRTRFDVNATDQKRMATGM